MTRYVLLSDKLNIVYTLQIQDMKYTKYVANEFNQCNQMYSDDTTYIALLEFQYELNLLKRNQ